MSRLESNAEPSMEEILASIRKIIAEDSSGLRSPSPPSRPGTPYTPAPRSNTPVPSPAPAPQRGFMSREAFLKSSQPVEPEERQAFAPLDPPRAAPAHYVGTSAPSRARARDDAHTFTSPSFDSPAREPLRARDDFAGKGSSPTKEPAQSAETKDAQTSSKVEPALALRVDPLIVADTAVETVEVVAVEQALPVFDESPSSLLKSEDSAPGNAPARSDTSRIEAQLSELLSEDLNALRQSRSQTPPADETVVEAEEMKSETFGLSNAEKPVSSSATESADPFAFDLGPSPFAAKPEPQRSISAPPAAAAPVQPAAPAHQPKINAPAPAPLLVEPDMHASKPFAPSVQAGPAFEVPRSPNRPSYGGAGYAAEPRFGEKSASAASPAASSPANGSSFSNPATPTSFASEPAAKAPTTVSEPESVSPKSRPTFAFPSVSATLGPSRKLEPLSDAFKAAPPPPPSPLESFAPAPEVAPVSQPTKALASPTAAADAQTEAVLQSMLPAATADAGLDRPMEDAVADLLRPLLKTWLAENMPKIVERALRREMSERLLPGQKSPKE